MVAAVSTYTAMVTRDGSLWFVDIPEVGIATQVRTLRDVDAMTTEAIALTLDVPPDTVTVHVLIDPGDSVRRHLQVAEQSRKESAEANARAASEVRAAARELAASGATLRDIGRVLNVSHQRAQQLVKG